MKLLLQTCKLAMLSYHYSRVLKNIFTMHVLRNITQRSSNCLELIDSISRYRFTDQQIITICLPQLTVVLVSVNTVNVKVTCLG